jgi:hypothetical protein
MTSQPGGAVSQQPAGAVTAAMGQPQDMTPQQAYQNYSNAVFGGPATQPNFGRETLMQAQQGFFGSLTDQIRGNGPEMRQPGAYQFRQNIDVGTAPGFYIDNQGNPVTDQMIEAGQDPYVNNQRRYKSPIEMGYQYNPAYSEWSQRNDAEQQARNADVDNWKKTFGEGYWSEGIDWDSGQSYGRGGELVAGGRVLQPAGDGTMMDLRTGERVYNAAPQSFIGGTQYDWKTLQPGEKPPAPTFGDGMFGKGGGMPIIGGPVIGQPLPTPQPMPQPTPGGEQKSIGGPQPTPMPEPVIGRPQPTPRPAPQPPRQPNSLEQALRAQPRVQARQMPRQTGVITSTPRSPARSVQPPLLNRPRRGR